MEWKNGEAWVVLSLFSSLSNFSISGARTNICYLNAYKLTFRFEKQYIEEVKLKAAEDIKDDKVKTTSVDTEKAEGIGKNSRGKSSNSSSAEQDLDTFLLGDLEDSDGGPGIFPC